MPIPGFLKLDRKRVAIASAAIVAATFLSVLVSWLQPRSIGVCVVTDYSFRQQADWRDVLQQHFDTANRVFRGTGIRWSFHHADEADPTGLLRNLEDRRQALTRAGCQADVLLGLSGRPGIVSSGDVPPFSHTAFVTESGGESMRAHNRLNFAQALATLFGAPHDAKGAGTLMTIPPESEKLPDPVKKLIGSLRWYDFTHDAAPLDGAWGERAFQVLTQAYAGHGSNPGREARQVIGMALAAQRDFPAAIRQIGEAVKLDPGHAASHVTLANLYSQNFQRAEAVREYRAAVRLAPDTAADHAGLAVGLANIESYDEALSELRDALRLDPKYAAAQAALGYVLSQQLGRINEAIEAYRAALEMDPHLTIASEGLARLETARSRAADTAAGRRKRVQAEPSSAPAHLDLALAEAQAGNVDAAITELRRAVQSDDRYGLAHLNLALLLSVRKDYRGALMEAEIAARQGFNVPGALLESLKRNAGV